MEYRSVKLSEDGKWSLALIKYTEEYKEYLEQIKKFNKTLADYIEKCPKIYSVQSEHQSYMIFLGEKYCIGGINIGTSFDEKNLELEIHFDENHICLPDAIYQIVEQIVDGLAYHFPDNERIEIRLLNNVDLTRYNRHKYIKMVYSEKLITYSCKNKYKNSDVKRTLEKNNKK